MARRKGHISMHGAALEGRKRTRELDRRKEDRAYEMNQRRLAEKTRRANQAHDRTQRNAAGKGNARRDADEALHDSRVSGAHDRMAAEYQRDDTLQRRDIANRREQARQRTQRIKQRNRRSRR